MATRMTTNNDNRKWVYDALTNKGVRMGTFEDFDKHVDDNKEWVYNTARAKGIDLGDYESFSNAISVSGKPGSVAQQVIDEYDASMGNAGAGYERPELPSLEERVNPPKFAPIESVQSNWAGDRNDVAFVQGQRNKQLQDLYRNEGLELIANADEEREIDKTFKAKPVEKEKDILANYAGRFSLTNRSIELQKELESKRAEVLGKYEEEFKNSPEYKEIAGRKYNTKEEVDAANKQLEETFLIKYRDRIEKDMQPYEDAYKDSMIARYGENMKKELNELNASNTVEQLKVLEEDISRLKEENEKKLKGYAGSGGNAMNALMGSRQYMQASEEDRQEAGALNAAGRLLEESQEIVDEAGKKGKTNFVSGLLRGIRDNAFDAEQWTFGLADMADSAYLLRAVQKAEKGEELTPAEEKLLDASVMNMAVNAYYGDMLGRGYKAGQVTAQSLPFMLEFAVNPVSSSGSVIAKNLLKYGMKKFGGKAVNRVVPRIAARLAGDTAAAAAMTGTTGAARVAADAMDRLAGNYEYGRGEDGQMQVEKSGDMSVGEAIARGFGTTLLENQSEMIFNAFKAGGKLARDAAGRSVSMFGGLADNELVKAVKRLRNAPMARELRQRTQIGGVFEEYGEEVYNNLASVATGDMSAEDALSVDTNIDTFLGLVPTQLAFSAIGLGGLVRENASARKRLRDFTGRLSEDERELFDELHEAIRGGGTDIPRDFIKATLADDRLSDEQKKERVFAVKDMLTEKKSEDLQTEAEAQEQEEPAMSSEEIQAGKVDTYRRWVRAQRRVSSFGIPQESLDGMTLTQLADNYDLDDKQVQAVAEYKDAQQQFGQYEADFNARLEAERQRAEQQARADVDRLGNKDTGMVTQASYKFSEKPVYVTGGTLAFAEDGTLDRDNSSDTVYYLGEDGKTHMAPASEFDGIVSSTPAENVVTQQAYDAETAFKQAEQASLQSPDIPAPEKGVTFNLNGANYVIERPTPDGGLLAYKLDEAGEIDIVNGNAIELSAEDYYNAKEAELWGTTLESVDNVLEVNPENANAPSDEDRNVSAREPEQTERPSEIVSGRSPQEDMPKYAQGDANVVLSSEQQLADLVATLPKKKTGELDYRSMTPQQQYDYTRLTESPEVAAEDLKADVEAKRAEIEKMKQQLAKATGGQRAELRDKVRGADKELAELEDFFRSVAPAREQAETPDLQPADLSGDEEYMDWVAENSEDPAETAAAYRSAKEAASHENNLRPWQQQLLGMKINTSSFNRFGDRNQVTGALAKGWLRKDGRQLDTLAQELSLLGEEVTEQDIVDFMLQNPSNHVSQRSEIMRKLAARFSEIASAEMGFPVGGPDSNTGRLYLILKEANQKLADLSEQQKQEVRQAIDDDMLDNDRQAQAVEEFITEDYAAAYDEAMRQTDEEEADARLASQIEEQGEPLYEGMTADELDEIYSSLTYTNYGTERQTAGSAENPAEPLQERTGESETPDDGEDIPAVDREDGEADSGTEQSETGTEALTSEGNYVPLQRNQTEEDNERTEVESLSGESGGLDGENEAENLLRETGHRTAAQDRQGNGTRESLLGELAERASRSHQWINDVSTLTSRPIAKGGENEAYLSHDGKSVIKVNDFSYLPDGSENFDSFLNRIEAHNELFPQDRINILGFTNNSEGKISVVLSQPYIGNSRPATQEEIDSFLEDMDFYTDMSGNWTDGIYEIADTKPNNVLVDEDGNLHFIDVLPYDTRKPGKMLEIPRNRDAFQAPAIERGENIFDYAERVAKAKETDDMRRSVDTNPTEAQKEAGNYKKGHVKLDGYNITIENPKGSTRSGRDAQGNEWSVTMQNDYGYIRGTKAVDGDHIDVFLSDTPEQGNVYVIDQIDQQTGEFDESKVMYGFNSMEEARDAYLSNYSTGWKVGPITEVSKDEFKKWIDSSTEKRKAFSEYKSVKAEAGQNQGQSTQSVNPSGNRLVTDERYAELKERMRNKLGGQLNVGIDPEILAIGTEMAVYHIEKGARKFADYAKAMIEDLGDVIRPYLKAFYNGARELPEVEEAGLSSELTPYEEVRKFDTANLGKTVMDVLAMAQTIADEQTIEKQADEVKGQINEGRAKKRKSSSSKSAKKTISSQKEIVNDLFNQNQQENEPRNQTENRSLGGGAREEDRGTGSRRESSGVHGRNVSDQDGSRGIHGGTGTERPVNPKQNTRNFRFGESGIDVPSGEIGKLKANIEAIRTLKEIEKSGEPATQEQKSKLSRYVGWGGLANALDENEYRRQKSLLDRYGDESRFYTPWGEKFYKYHKELKQLLTPEEFRSAIESTTTSHYTPEEIIQALWNIVQRAGFKGGTVIEPALGIGHILGFMPENLSENSNISGFELDTLSGRIASALYPDARIKVQGYETEFAPQSKDLVITNVPFAKEAPYDKALDKAFRKKLGSSYNLHNYFILKSLLELKEGGLGVFVTSSATMDGVDSRFREYVSGNGIDLVGAIRLPNDAFQKNAGTSVTADILVFRKRKPGEPGNGIRFTSTTQIGEGSYEENGETRTKPIMVNEYFAEHPDVMLGEMMTAHDAGSGGLYSGASQTLKAKPGSDLGKALREAVEKLPEGVFADSAEGVKRSQREQTDMKNGQLVAKDGKVFVSENGELSPVQAKDFKYNGKTRKVADAINDYNAIKTTLKELIAEEQKLDGNPEPLRKKLNELYDVFVEKYGTLNRNKALDDVFAEDVEHNLPLSLETVKRVPSATGKSMVYVVEKAKGILSKRISYPVKEPEKAESLQDAINISQSYRGSMDVPYISRLLEISEEEVTDRLLEEGAAYRDPITGELQDKDTYLSGNVREKLEVAISAAENNPEYKKNVDDLTEVQPETVRFGDISFRLGTPWVPTEHVNKFVEDVLGITDADVSYMPSLNEFVLGKRARVTDFAKSGMFRTDRMGVIDLFDAAINQRKPKIYDEHTEYGPNGKTTIRVPNEAETQAVSEKIMEISDKFTEYIENRKDLHRELERIYNDRYNNYRLKEYRLPAFTKVEKNNNGKDVTIIHYPNSNIEISLREHQAKAVQRSLSESTLLAHQVGTGKTFTMITTAMEMRRLGIARKPMIVVQNATLEDFVRDFYKLYPGANVLAPSKDERSAENRKRLFNLIATGDFDAIVIPQSFLQFIPDDEGRKKQLIQKRIDELEDVLSNIEEYGLRKRLEREIDGLRDSFEGVEKKRKVKDKAKASARIKAKMERQLDRRTDDVMTFEQMGIDALFIDEAHNFKKIGFATKMNNVKGVDSSASQRANSLLLKAKWIQEKNGGRNVILATGTPITNTMAEVWTMMNFVAPEILDAYQINSFDDFATTFGTVEPSLEFTATGNFKIADRFKSYVNVPELVKAFRSHTDVVLTEDVKEFKEKNNIPKLKDSKMTNIVIDKNEDLEDVMQTLINRLEEYNNMSGEEKRKWSALPLVVFTKAKQAAIDLRLLNPSYPDNPNSKTNQVVNNIVKLYKESTPDKGTQLVFCDSYQSPGEEPKMDLFDYNPDVPRFNLYDDIREKLISQGIPANEIAVVNNYDGERRKTLFEKVRNGDVRVLLGSTEKMGVGVNVQDRLYALHHIDAPIRPMDFEQRNGRILRQGNLYAVWGKPVNVVTYGVQGTLDATAYDRLRIKQAFINQMMKGDVSGRIMEEQDEDDPSGMTFSQMAATLSGDKTAQLLFAAQNKLKRLRNLKRTDANSKSSMGDAVESARNRIILLESKKKVYERAYSIVEKFFPEGVTDVNVNGRTITDKIGSELDEIISAYDDKYSLNRGLAPLKISLNKGNAEVVVHYIEGRMVYELYAGGEHVVEGRQFNGGRGLMSSIDHQLKATKKNLDETNSSIEELHKRISGLTEAMSAPWGREEELKEAEREVENLQKQLEEKAAENSKNKTSQNSTSNNDVRFRFIGEQGAYRLDAAEEATTRLDNLSVARDMEEGGKDAKAIKLATGWERGADRKWRYETSDFEYYPNGDARKDKLIENRPWYNEYMTLVKKLLDGETLTDKEQARYDELYENERKAKQQYEDTEKVYLNDYVRDDELFNAYPELKQTKVLFVNKSNGEAGSYLEKDNTITININSEIETRSILAHEIQHAIQHIEGFSVGGSPNTPYTFNKSDILPKIEEANVFIEKYGDNFLKKARENSDADFSNGSIFILKMIGRNKRKMSAEEGRAALMKLYAEKGDVRALGLSGYKRLSGEVEARNVQSRLGMTEEERRNSLASETEDVARKDQIFLYDSLVQNSETYSSENEIVSSANDLSSRLNTPIRIANSLDEVTNNSARSAIESGRKVKAWFEPSTGEVVIYLPNATSINDVKRSVLHEVVGHKGLRELIGPERYDNEMIRLFGELPASLRKEISGKAISNYNGDVSIAMDEYLAEQAERDETPTWWEKVVSAVRDMLRSIGINVELTKGGVKYLLWRSRKKLMGKNVLSVAEDTRFRQGEGAYSDEVLSLVNDPFTKLIGKSTRSKKKQTEFAERERRRMVGRARSLAEQLGLDNVEIVTDVSTLEGRKARAKGFFDPKTGKITIVIPNHTNSFDVEQTLLHESVAHYGLRRLFGRHFETFLDNVYNNSSPEVKERIDALVEKYNGDVRTATEEYLASLAENTDFENAVRSGWFDKIKQFFLRMLAEAGIELPSLTDNELRYILWRSYENLAHPGHYRNVFDTATDVAMQYELKVGNYAEPATVGSVAASESVQGLKAERIEKLRNSKPVEITGEEYKGKYELNRDSAKQWIKDNLRGEYTNKDTGEKIEIRKDGAQNVTSHSMGSEAHLKSLVAIPQMIENSVFIEDRPNEKDNYKYDRYRYYVCGLKIGDVDYTAKITVGVKGASKYYDHSLTKIEKGTLIDNIDALSTTFDNNQNALVSGIKDTKLLSILQENGEETAESEGNLLFREADEEPEYRKSFIRDRYERRMKSGLYQSAEAFMDSMQSLKETMDMTLEATGKKGSFEDVPGWMNAYFGENALSSVNEKEVKAMQRLLFKPLKDVIAFLARTKEEYEKLINYMFAKHGLERNIVMAQKRAERDFAEYQKSTPHGEKTLNDFLAEYRNRDYAGLTALTGTDNVADAEAMAERMVNDYEANHDTTKLWEKVNTANKAILSKTYDSGLISKETYEKVRDMYKYYIPLRGFDEKTGEETYAYLNHNKSSFNTPIKEAYGRNSKADDPIANMESMAESAVLQGNRNVLVKQRFLNFALNHPTDLVSVSELWLEYNARTDEWRVASPDINMDDTPKVVERKMREFEERMTQLAQTDPNRYKRASDAKDIPYRVLQKTDLLEHQVLVKLNGNDYILTVNGNPRLAQALNGKTNPDNESTGAVSTMISWAGDVNRTLSANYTQMSPDFVAGNFARDSLYSNIMVWIKESPRYARKFNVNYGRLNTVVMKMLFAKYRNGKLDMNNERERLFKEFLDNGGETGYARMMDVDKHRKEIERFLKAANGKIPLSDVRAALGEWLGEIGRSIESQSRFAAYITSRQEGRDVARSVWDAKEISVNFNKKGAGDKFLGANGQTLLGNISALGSGLGRAGHIFWNAALQGTFGNFLKNARRHPVKALTAVASMFSLGFLVSALGAAGDDGDDDNYYNNPDYVRRTNLLIKGSGKTWLKIPLSIEFRAVYGMGELLGSAFFQGETVDTDEFIGQFTQLLPIDMMAGQVEGDFNWVKPLISISSVRPVVDVMTNVSWTGKPIYKDTPYNKLRPEWTKVYKSTNRYLVDLAAALSDATGGDKALPGVIDLNPAAAEYLMRGYFGGLFTLPNQLVKLFTNDFEWRNVPVANRFVASGDERTRYGAINDLYYSYGDIYDRVQTQIKVYSDEIARGSQEYLEKYRDLQYTDDFKIWEIFKSANKEVTKLNEAARALPEGEEEEYKELERMAYEVKKQAVEQVRAIMKDKKE